MKRLLPLLIAAAFSTTLTSGMAIADPAVSAMADKVKVAMASSHRTDAEKLRDDNRLPVETLTFLGIKDTMTVVELIPGRGWYSKLLAPALRDKGQLYVAYATSRLEKMIPENPNLTGTKVTAPTSALQRNPALDRYDLVNPDLIVRNVDAVLTFRNYHNFAEAGRMAMNKAAYDALKPGGIYGVVDHTRRHMQDDNDENGRRVDPVLAIKEIQASGFEFVDYSTLHYRADDELRYEVGRKTVTGNTDRFTLLFKKPLNK